MAKILLVEDDNSLREIYGAQLEAEGYTIFAAQDGEEALAIAVREKPDLIITDVMMPKISGFDMLDILRSTPETKDVKVIVLTALSQDEDKKRGEQLGADGYIVKSQVMLEDVVAKVKEILKDLPEKTDQPVASPQPSNDNLTTEARDAHIDAQPEPQEATQTSDTPNATPIADSQAVPITPPVQSSDDTAQPTVVSSDPVVASDPVAAATPTDNSDPVTAPTIDPADLSALNKEVEQFVATSPLMNGVKPEPQAQTQNQPQSDQNIPSDQTTNPQTSPQQSSENTANVPVTNSNA